jgi:hypothetical protein
MAKLNHVLPILSIMLLVTRQCLGASLKQKATITEVLFGLDHYQGVLEAYSITAFKKYVSMMMARQSCTDRYFATCFSLLISWPLWG